MLMKHCYLPHNESSERQTLSPPPLPSHDMTSVIHQSDGSSYCSSSLFQLIVPWDVSVSLVIVFLAVIMTGMIAHGYIYCSAFVP